jgi:hypothetical protein
MWLQSDVDEFMGRTGNDDTSQVLKQLDESHTKYRFMEQNLMQKKRRLKKQIPDIETSIDVLKLVKHKRVNHLIAFLSNELVFNVCVDN